MRYEPHHRNRCGSLRSPASYGAKFWAWGGCSIMPEKLEEFDPREVRRILVSRYEIRYEIQESTIYVLRLWHTREDR